MSFKKGILMVKTILCYGDSNTWGGIPQPYRDGVWPAAMRYPRHKRWTGLLQQHLGEAHYVIEEGLNARTTNLDYAIAPNRNGASYLPPCLYSHAPIDWVLLALGGNDLKSCFNRSVVEVGEGLRELIDIIQCSNYGPELTSAPAILIVSQVIPLAMCENYSDTAGQLPYKGICQKVHDLVDIYATLAKEKQCEFLNITPYVRPSVIDGVHFDEKGHEDYALQVYQKLIES